MFTTGVAFFLLKVTVVSGGGVVFTRDLWHGVGVLAKVWWVWLGDWLAVEGFLMVFTVAFLTS